MTDTDIHTYAPPKVYGLGTIAEMTNWQSGGSADVDCWDNSSAPGCGGDGTSVAQPQLSY